jgi:hypothetical protein
MGRQNLAQPCHASQQILGNAGKHFLALRSVLVAALFAVTAMHASADDIMKKAVNDPDRFWNLWGIAASNFVKAPQLKGGAAQRLVISPKPAKPENAGVNTVITQPVKKGDVLVMTFWARVEKGPSDSDLVTISVRIAEDPPSNATIGRETVVAVGKVWRLYSVNAKAPKDYSPGELRACLILGTGEQTIDLGPAAVLDFGPNYNSFFLLRN